MFKPPISDFLDAINEEIKIIDECVEGMNRESFKDSKSFRCSAMCFQNIGDVIPRLRRKHPKLIELNDNINWDSIENIRGTQLECDILWDIIETILPVLKRDLKNLILPDPADEEQKIDGSVGKYSKPAIIFEKNRQAIRDLVDEYEFISNPRIYGSIANGDSNNESDIDILVDFHEKGTLFDLGGFKIKLINLLKAPVDLSCPQYLLDHCRERILSEAKPV